MSEPSGSPASTQPPQAVRRVQGEFAERSARPRTRAVPLSHLSLELGHLYLEDVAAGPNRIRQIFAEVAPWAQAARAAVAGPSGRPRISTCFLIDDYFSDLVGPAEVVPDLIAAASDAGVRVDYLVREAGCARTSGPAGELSPAELLVSRLVEEPEPGTTGWRPSSAQSGWLSNGRRSPTPAADRAAMDVREWVPPLQNAARRHSIFVDVQLWDDKDGRRTWSCPLLAATWQFLRLGLMRHNGEPVIAATARPEVWPAAWSQLPTIVQLEPDAAPFAAYTSTSILSPRFLPVELAVRTILGQVWTDPVVAAQLDERAGAERFRLAAEPLDRIRYVFAGESVVDPPT
jgi:hypothetical protein